MIPDIGGAIRWEILAIKYGENYYPSLALQSVRQFVGLPREAMILEGGSSVRLGRISIPTDSHGRMLIDYSGPEKTFKYISIIDLLEGRVKREEIEGKIALVGITALGLYDLRVTPFSDNMPGVEKHANVIENIFRGEFLRRNSQILDLAIILLVGLILAIILPRMKAVSGAIVSIALLAIYTGITYYLFVNSNLWIDYLYPSLNIIIVYTGVTIYRYASEEKRAREIRNMFSSYVTEKVVNELIKNPDMAKLGGERREITVLFSDVRGFTSFSEKHSAEEVVSILNEYLEEMTGVVFRWDGTLDKFIGDAILAFWGAPMKQENHAELAIKCALDMIRRLKELQQKWQSEGKPILDCGIGINTGKVLVGNIGAEGKKMDYTVIGDHVNLGSRVESLTRKYNVNILITGFTLDKIKDLVNNGTISHVHIKGLERVAVKGKEKSVEILELTSLEPGAESVIEECEEAEVVVLKEK